MERVKFFSIDDMIYCRNLRNCKIVIPGGFTPTEILQAYEWGADIVKVFPASVLGSQFIKDVRGPVEHIPMMPTGGISLENIEE